VGGDFAGVALQEAAELGLVRREDGRAGAPVQLVDRERVQAVGAPEGVIASDVIAALPRALG
jgi:hypothetical protein